ncbi:RNA polymerase II C-terminal domain phosphatase-like 3 [Quillaja saponaria]|uniref:protein-serine/threonine phosphatase n=1 Tax=Quillaja saponaria TaxID=32244 RepID=A0AAD7KTR1_QUISA|nr:RNA polymerase II C-terminal domain phosphatase-like 3 [Quillaja saponaria]
MGKDDTKVEDVEEGEISDSVSVEEITEEDFNKQEVKYSKETKSPKEDTRVWAVHDLYNKYPTICHGYASGLYNLAWAQAVQNKPLNDIFVMEVDPNDKSKRPSFSPSVNAKDVDKVVIVDSGDEMDIKVVDVEKEEGELEEGEIDLDSDASEQVNEQGLSISMTTDDRKLDSEGKDLEKQVNSIREALKSITVSNAEKSFEESCSTLQSSLESLVDMLSECNVFVKDVLVQTSFSAIEVVNSVLCSMNHCQKEQKKDKFRRLLSFTKNLDAPLFSPGHMKQIQDMIMSLDSIDDLSSFRAKDNELQIFEVQNVDSVNSAVIAGHEKGSLNKSTEPVVLGSSVNNISHAALEVLKPEVSSGKGRGVLLPLLDLHKKHDADSLPSPTREAPSCFSLHKALYVGDGMIKSGLATAKVEREREDSKFLLYETDALKAFSTYQQKFGRGSFLMNDKLPSPTPSEEGDNGDGNITDEVSSSSNVDFSNIVKPPVLGQSAASSSISVDVNSSQGPFTFTNSPPVSFGSYPVKTSAKSRDPRLWFVNSDVSSLDLNQHPLPLIHNAPKVESAEILSSRKQKIVEETILDGPLSKRQKREFENPVHRREVKAVPGTGGWLEDTMVGQKIVNSSQLTVNADTELRNITSAVANTSSSVGTTNVASSGNEPAPVTCTNTAASLPALLKDIAVNPTMLLNILLEQQQKLAAEAVQKSAEFATSTTYPSCSGSVVGVAPMSAVPSNASGVLQKPVGTLVVPSQPASMSQSPQEDTGKIRMKPRDPRRILHGVLQKGGSIGSDQVKADAALKSGTQGSLDNATGQKPEVQAELETVPSQTVPSVPPPDIARQFTKNLNNIADIMSVTQASANQPIVSQTQSSASGPLKPDLVDLKTVVSSSENQHAGTSTAIAAPDAGVAALSRPQSTWGDVEHLFEGYDDRQKAAIQRERSRRIEEQKKMFAARKLCLVLDLDHTLLNSAKFVEVDPVHDEILRKKEEQDREKPHRHLFRFPHMGMWTKLRPGVWNFLEKASKLYELHLYTMGNKLYATEMAKVLDPKGVLFSGRVISRGDDGEPFDGDERVPKSKDLEGVLGMESAVVIIDDSLRVWPHNKLNLIVVERYTYFPCSRRQFGLLGPSLLEIDHDERPEDGTLASSLAVIEKIHQIFFSHLSLEEADVRNILATEQRKILGGCRIVFSRVFPVGEANPHLHPLWQTAEQFGAVCTNQIDEQVTHVVANSLGTDKVNWALSTGRFVVHPGWVEASALLYRRANERDFSIKP